MLGWVTYALRGLTAAALLAWKTLHCSSAAQWWSYVTPALGPDTLLSRPLPTIGDRCGTLGEDAL